ncbi:hypothetical protein ABTL25_20315, partial [Acinetobacter baumannii]
HLPARLQTFEHGSYVIDNALPMDLLIEKALYESFHELLGDGLSRPGVLDIAAETVGRKIETQALFGEPRHEVADHMDHD